MTVKSCSERLPEMLKTRLKEIKKALEDDDKREEFYEGFLAVSKRIVYDVQLSWGGPADGFKVIVDPETGEIEAIEYYFADWFDYASVRLSKEEHELVEEVLYPLLDIYDS